MEINERLKETRSNKKRCLDNIETLKMIKRQEIKNTTKAIEDKYNSKIKDVEQSYKVYYDEVINKCKEIEKYSIFNLIDLSKVLASLMTFFESENYIVKKNMAYQIKTSLHKEVFLIINENKYNKIKSNDIQNRYYHHLIKQGYAICLLSDFNKLPENISFYEADSMGRINQKIQTHCYHYVKEFIDYVINYRIDNNVEEITLEELNELKNEFIINNIDRINQYHKIIDDKKREEFDINLEHTKKIRQRKLNKIKENLY